MKQATCQNTWQQKFQESPNLLKSCPLMNEKTCVKSLLIKNACTCGNKNEHQNKMWILKFTLHQTWTKRFTSKNTSLSWQSNSSTVAKEVFLVIKEYVISYMLMKNINAHFLLNLEFTHMFVNAHFPMNPQFAQK